MQSPRNSRKDDEGSQVSRDYRSDRPRASPNLMAASPALKKAVFGSLWPCGVFAGFPANLILAQLAGRLARHGRLLFAGVGSFPRVSWVMGPEWWRGRERMEDSSDRKSRWTRPGHAGVPGAALHALCR